MREATNLSWKFLPEIPEMTQKHKISTIRVPILTTKISAFMKILMLTRTVTLRKKTIREE